MNIDIVKTFLAIVVLTTVPGAVAEESLQELATDTCLTPGLSVAPPSPWYSVPIESGKPGIFGCQMIWEAGDQYMGIMRLVSFDAAQYPPSDIKWENLAIAFEVSVMEQMNFKIGELIWKRDTVPVSGEGFANAKAIGLQAHLEGVEQPNEVHFLLFEGVAHKYVISMLTPSESTNPDVYRKNTQAMGAVMQTLQPR